MSRQKTTEQFVAESQEVWGNRWDYTNTVYVKALEALTITCPKHGDFKQIPVNHTRRSVGCMACRDQLTDTPTFIKKASKTWGSRWGYSKVEYINQKSKVIIQCSSHGDFKQMPKSHIKGYVGCPQCHGMIVTQKDFVSRGKLAHPDRSWDYSEAEYINMKTPIRLTCSEHGEYRQRAEKHLLGMVGCVPCQSTQSSQKEKDLANFISTLGMDYQTNCRGLISPPKSEIDVYIPSKKIGVEFNGLYWHSSKFRDSKSHSAKYQAAADKGIKLIQIWEDDWRLRREIVEEHLRQVFGVSNLPKISARKTHPTEVSSSVAKEFLTKNHIQGFVGASHYLGLHFKGDLVALASFKRSGEDYTLVRYATSANVQGGHSKLVTHFERSHNYRNLVTFADLTFGSGGLYQKTGWVKDKTIRPDYSYLVGGVREHKFNYRLKRFREDPNLQYVGGMSESQLAELNGLLKVYDAGKLRFVKPHPSS